MRFANAIRRELLENPPLIALTSILKPNLAKLTKIPTRSGVPADYSGYCCKQNSNRRLFPLRSELSRAHCIFIYLLGRFP